jgi:hypothetical protein
VRRGAFADRSVLLEEHLMLGAFAESSVCREERLQIREFADRSVCRQDVCGAFSSACLD